MLPPKQRTMAWQRDALGHNGRNPVRLNVSVSFDVRNYVCAPRTECVERPTVATIVRKHEETSVAGVLQHQNHGADGPLPVGHPNRQRVVSEELTARLVQRTGALIFFLAERHLSNIGLIT